jgi:hypothetical protein
VPRSVGQLKATVCIGLQQTVFLVHLMNNLGAMAMAADHPKPYIGEFGEKWAWNGTNTMRIGHITHDMHQQDYDDDEY